MNEKRITLLNGELALGIYHDTRETVDEDAIKMDFHETAGKEEWRLFRSNQVRIGLSLPEAKALRDQLDGAIEDHEFVRSSPEKTKTARTRKSTVRLRRP
jgi:hypothetical protein